MKTTIAMLLSLAVCLACEDEKVDLSSKPLAAPAAVTKPIAAAARAPAPGAPLALDAKLRIGGRVLDADRAPVAGAKVSLLRLPSPVQTATTDAQGHFEFADQAPGKFDLAVEHAAHPMARFIGVVPGNETVEIVLDRSGSLLIEVVKAGGAPAPGGTAWVSEGAEAGKGPSRGYSSREGSNLIEVPAVRVGSVGLRVIAPGALPAQTQTTVSAGHQTKVRIEVAAGTALAGRLVDAAGKPVPNVEVMTTVVGAVIRATTDEGGFFELTGLQQGSYHVWANFGRQQLGDATGVPGKPLELRLPPLARVSGRLVRGGEPAGVAVCRKVEGGMALESDGRFSFLVDPAFSSLTFEAGGGQVTVPVQLKDGATVELGDLEVGAPPPAGQLAPGKGAIHCTMTFKGQPVAGMAVWVHIPTAAFNRSIKTDARGEALLTNIEPATYEFFGKDPGHLAKATATVKAAETTELKVEATGAGGILGKLKTTQRGCSVHVVAVNAPRGRPAGAYYPVAADGSFSIESLEPGEYSAAPSCGTRKSAETKLMVKAGEVTQLALAED